MGEYQVINYLAKLNMDNGDSAYWACKNAVTQFRIAMKEAISYEYVNNKGEFRTGSRKRKKYKIKKFKLSHASFNGNFKEYEIVRDLCRIMNEDGYVLGHELLSYVSDCINQEIVLNELWGTTTINKKKIFNYLQDEINRVIRNLEKQAMDDLFKGGASYGN